MLLSRSSFRRPITTTQYAENTKKISTIINNKKSKCVRPMMMMASSIIMPLLRPIILHVCTQLRPPAAIPRPRPAPPAVSGFPLRAQHVFTTDHHAAVQPKSRAPLHHIFPSFPPRAAPSPVAYNTHLPPAAFYILYPSPPGVARRITPPKGGRPPPPYGPPLLLYYYVGALPRRRLPSTNWYPTAAELATHAHT